MCRFSGEQKFPSCIAQEGKDAWREISRSTLSRDLCIWGGFRLCLSYRKPPRLAFEAIAAFLDRSAAAPARCRRGKLKFNPTYFAVDREAQVKNMGKTIRRQRTVVERTRSDIAQMRHSLQ